MFERIANGFALARSSWAVLLKDKHLLIFPFISGILFLVVVASFAVPLALLVDWNQFGNQQNNVRVPWWAYAVAFGFYFCTYFVTIFCNSALLSCTFLRFNGETPTVADGFRLAVARLPQILAWALVSATVGVLLKVAEQAHEKVGELIAGLLGAAWSVMTFFVVPVLVVEKVGPVDAVKRSISLIRKTWGEALVGRAGIGFVLFLLAIPLILLFLGGVFLIASGMAPVGIALLIVGGVLTLLYMAVSSALHTILLAALYQYAADNRVPEGFDRQVFAGTFARA
ncbi:MAG: hypothetical protein JWO38_6809 [Gemmataceae bacterium]|nr:hypothetical protein [Gemmataceae bacterium]